MLYPLTDRVRPALDRYGFWLLGAVITAGAAALVLALSPVQALAAIAGLGLFLVLLRHPGLGLYLIVGSVPIQDLVLAPLPISIGASGNTTITQVMVILTGGAWLLHKALTRERLLQPRIAFRLPPRHGVAEAPKHMRLSPLYTPISIFLCVLILSMCVSTSLKDSLNEFSRWVIAFFVYILCVETVKTRRSILWLVTVFCLGVAGEALYGVYQSFNSVGPASFALANSSVFRGSGTFGAPNSFAGYLEHGFGLALALTFWAWHKRGTDTRGWLTNRSLTREKRQHLGRIYIRANCLALALTGLTLVLAAAIIISSRGATLGLVAALIVMTVAIGRKGIPMLMLVGVVGLALWGAASFNALPSAITDRVGSITDQLTPFDTRHVYIDDANFAVVERMAMWQAGTAMFEHSPILGVGIGNYNTVYSHFAMPQFPESRGHAHNYYINTMAETGMVGLAAYLFLLGAAFATTFRTMRLAARLKVDDGLYLAIAWGTLGVLAAIATHDLVEDLHVLNMSLHLFAMLGLIYAVQRILVLRLSEQALG